MFGTMSDRTVYVASDIHKPSDQFNIHAENVNLAWAELLDKIGYQVMTVNRTEYVMADADDSTLDIQPLSSLNLVDAIQEACRKSGWQILEPMELIGGALTGGFSIDTDQH